MEFDFNLDYRLENERVLLRPLQAEDVAHLLHFSVNEPEIWKYSLLQAGGGAQHLEKYIDLALRARKAKTDYPFIVFDKLHNRYAGSTRFYDVQLAHKTMLLGYTWYGKEFQGTGLNAHCKLLLLQFAFEDMGIERVEFRANSSNARSIAAMKRIGCVEEGVLRSHIPDAGGQRRDSIILSILKPEWHTFVKTNLKTKLGL